MITKPSPCERLAHSRPFAGETLIPHCGQAFHHNLTHALPHPIIRQNFSVRVTMDLYEAAEANTKPARKSCPLTLARQQEEHKLEQEQICVITPREPGRILAEVTVPENMRFRQMELRDAAAVFHLGEEVFNADSFPQLYRTWDSFEVIENLSGDGELCLVAEELLESDSNGTVAVAAKGSADGGDDTAVAFAHPQSRIVGFIFGSITEKRKREHSCGLLGWVGVAPSHQRRNIGTVLAHKLFEQFWEDGISLIVADTPMENTPAIKFLHRMGFCTPVYHIYMSLNLSRHHHRAQHLPPAPERILPPEAKGVKLRPMSIDDLAAVHDLGEKIYDQYLYPNLYRIWSESEVVELFGSDSEFCQVAEYEGRVVGFVMGTTISKRRSSWRYGYLVWLGVAPEVQRFGVGKRLFQAFHDLMVEDGCRIIMIDTQADNVPARKFFERAGFGSLESHVYFSKQVGPDDLIASEERVLRQASLTGGGHSFSSSASTTKSSIVATKTVLKLGEEEGAGGGRGRAAGKAGGPGKHGRFKVTRLFRFKRARSVLETAVAAAGLTAAAIGDGGCGGGRRGGMKTRLPPMLVTAAAAAVENEKGGDKNGTKKKVEERESVEAMPSSRPSTRRNCKASTSPATGGKMRAKRIKK